MKFRFESDLDYQLQAIASVTDVFKGQESCRTEFTVTSRTQLDGVIPGLNTAVLGIGNRLALTKNDILENVNGIQLRNGLPPCPAIESMNFTIEMETGTGKTYVYLRTIFELNRLYGFTKFAIVVPSVAIKEGVYETLRQTREHFRELYAGVPYHFFIYNSSKLGQVHNFAVNSNIEIMIMTVGAINKQDVNSLYKENERTGGERPIDLIKTTQPVLIVDEPQSVDGGLHGRGKVALEAMEPLCTLRYSATPLNKFNMLFRLDAVDAYDRKLVKQIEVASATISDAGNSPYVRLISCTNKGQELIATVELDTETATGRNRKEVVVRSGYDLERITKRSLYHGYRIGRINCAKQNKYVELVSSSNSVILIPGQAVNDVDPLALQRLMIRKTIMEHFDKEKRLNPKGIKVLSLFFIDEVAKYEKYDKAGNRVKGVYAHIFEDEYKNIIRLPGYAQLTEFTLDEEAANAYRGYFSIDRRRIGNRTVEEFRDTKTGESQADDDTYALIMRKKGELLGFASPVRFIFSHSALREGWDNPNVFQICALRDIRTVVERRQTVGRGLRLCVEQSGERIHDAGVNTLTVIAGESYEEFARNLQTEIEDATGIHFGVVVPYAFAQISVEQPNSIPQTFGVDASNKLWKCLIDAGYLSAEGKILESLRSALRDGNLSLPSEYSGQISDITGTLQKLAGGIPIRKRESRVDIKVSEEILNRADFQALWTRIKQKTIYNVDFDNEALVQRCIKALRDSPYIPSTTIQWQNANINIDRAGVTTGTVTSGETDVIAEQNVELPDLLTELEYRTYLTRRTLEKIVVKSERLDDFKQSPQSFIERAAHVINFAKSHAIVDGIKYQCINNDFYSQEIFKSGELTAYAEDVVKNTAKTVYDTVPCDSAVEKRFVDSLERADSIMVYAKLPQRFTISTPLGNYTPDWAILLNGNQGQRLYFVVETKGTIYTSELRSIEQDKINCGLKHFQELARDQSSPAEFFFPATKLEDLLRHVAGVAEPRSDTT